MDKKLVFIVGLQKSGTFVLKELLLKTGLVENPFNGEGHDFWGDVPVFSPKEYPTGMIYQKYKGEMGHEINSDEATDETIESIKSQLPEKKIKIIKGHIPVDLHNYLDQQSNYITMLREPVKRVISAYYFRQNVLKIVQ